MGIYLYQNPKTNEVVEIFQHMNDIHEYEKDGIKYKRVWINPQVSIDSLATDPFSSKDFNRITNKKDTIGSLFDRSAELSEKRKEKEGIDKFKEGFYQDYSKKHKGQSHPEQKREKSKKKLDEMGINVNWGE